MPEHHDIFFKQTFSNKEHMEKRNGVQAGLIKPDPVDTLTPEDAV